MHNTKSILFIDRTVDNYETLLNGVILGVEVILLDIEQNGITQITSTLAKYQNLDSIQIISHGNDGTLYLGNSELNNENIDTYSNELTQWGKSLTESGDILLLGCNVAITDQGKNFVNTLSNITDADVTASENLTGNSNLGGDWVLEYQTGDIESSLAFLPETLANYEGVLVSGLTGYYWNYNGKDATYSNSNASKTLQENININLGKDANISGVDKDFFARWEGSVITTTSGNYTFQTRNDDGIRVYLDKNGDNLFSNDELIINDWSNGTARTNTSSVINLTAEKLYKIKVEFYDQKDEAVAQLSWKTPSDSTYNIIPKVNFLPQNYTKPKVSIQTINVTNNKGYENELNNKYAFRISVDNANNIPDLGMSVSYKISGTATNNLDYTDSNNGKVTFKVGETFKDIILIKDDYLKESDETITITIDSGSVYQLGTSVVTLTLQDNEPVFTLKTDPSNETNKWDEGSKTFKFNIEKISGDIKSGGTPVYYRIIKGTTQNEDFTLLDGTVTYTSSDNKQNFPVSVIKDDLIYEGETAETFTLELKTDTGYALSGETKITTFSIQENEPLINIYTDQSIADEGKAADAANQMISNFKIDFNRPSPQNFDLYFNLSGTAIPGTFAGTKQGSDYKILYQLFDQNNKLIDDTKSVAVPIIGTNKLIVSKDTKFITVQVQQINDEIYEKDDETVNIELLDNYNGIIADGYGVDNNTKIATVTIKDNEPVISISKIVHPTEGFGFGSTINALGKALNLKGDNYLKIAQEEKKLTFDQGTFTLESWVFPNLKDDQYYPIIFGDSQTAINRFPTLGIVNKTDIQASFSDGKNEYIIKVDKVLNADVWNQIATTFDGTDYKIFVNGVEVYSTTQFQGKIPSSTTQNILIGSDGTNNFSGTIDEVRIWNKARSQAEIQQNLLNISVEQQEGLIGYWQFEDNLTDNSDNNNTAILIGNNDSLFIDNPSPQIGYIELTLDKPVDLVQGLWVDYTINSNSTATQNVDYYNSRSRRVSTDLLTERNNIIIPEGETTARIYFSALPDAISEGNETINITLLENNFDIFDANNNGIIEWGEFPQSFDLNNNQKLDTDEQNLFKSNYGLTAQNSATITIKDNQNYSVGLVFVDEDNQILNNNNPLVVDENGKATFQVKLTSQPVKDVTVNLTNNKGILEKNDLKIEVNKWDQSQTIILTNLQPNTTLDITAKVTSLDNKYNNYQKTQTFSLAEFDDLKVIEGSSTDGANVTPVVSVFAVENIKEGEGKTGQFKLQLSFPASKNGITINYEIKGSAINGEDYENLALNLVIPEGQTTAILPVIPINDYQKETQEAITIELQSGADYSVAPTNNSATINITDDEKPALVFSDVDISSIPAKYALEFTGNSDSYLKLNQINLTGNFTIETDIYLNQGEQINSNLIDLGEIKLGFDEKNRLFLTVGSTKITTEEILADGTWYNVKAVNDGEGNSYLYVNNILRAWAKNQDIVTNLSQINNFVGVGFNGRIETLKIWDNQQIDNEQDFNTDLILYFKSEGNEIDTINDLSGNNNHGQLNQVNSIEYEAKRDDFSYSNSLEDVTISENGSQQIIGIRLNSQPKSNVTIKLTNPYSNQIKVEPLTLDFTSDNWQDYQLVTLSSPDDQIKEEDLIYSIIAETNSNDPDYQGLKKGIKIINLDDDSGINEENNATENGINEPLVTLSVNQNTLGENEVITVNFNRENNSNTEPITVYFNLQQTTANWLSDFTLTGVKQYFLSLQSDNTYKIEEYTDQTIDNNNIFFGVEFAPGEVTKQINISAVDDKIAELPETFNLILIDGEGYTIDGINQNNNPGNFTDKNSQNFTITDNDQSGVTITALQATNITSETGTSLTYQVVLDTQPIKPVKVYFGSNDSSEGLLTTSENSPPQDTISLKFTPDNWNKPQNFTVIGVNDQIQDGNIFYQIVPTLESEDSLYDSLQLLQLSLMNSDDLDRAGIIIIPPGAVIEGRDNVYSVKLASQPNSKVEVIMTPAVDQIQLNNAKIGDPLSLYFDSNNWNQEQTIRVLAFDDQIVEYNQITNINIEIITPTKSALDFNQNDLEFTLDFDLNSKNFTQEFWFNSSTNNQVLLTLTNENNQRSIFLENGNLVVKSAENQVIFATNNLNLATGKWYHLAYNNEEKLYLNGELVAENSAINEQLIPQLKLEIPQEFEGTVREIRTWQTARSQAQIQGYMTEELYGDEGGLIAYYKADEAIGDLLLDSTNNKNHLTLSSENYWSQNWQEDPNYYHPDFTPDPLPVLIIDNDLPTAKITAGKTASEVFAEPSYFNISLNAPLPKQEGNTGLEVNYRLIGGTATLQTEDEQGKTLLGDYRMIDQGSVRLDPGNIQGNLIVSPIDDKLPEDWLLTVDQIETTNQNDELKLTLSSLVIANSLPRGTQIYFADGIVATVKETNSFSAIKPNTELVSLSSTNVRGNNDSISPSISDDGRYLTFLSSSNNLTNNDNNNQTDIFIHDRQIGETKIIPRSNSNQPYRSVISGNGDYVVFDSLVSVGYDIFLYNIRTGETQNITQGNGSSINPSISDDGRYITFESEATNLAENDQNNRKDIFIYDQVTKTIKIITQGNDNSENPAISGDGRYITFQSLASDLNGAGNDSYGSMDIFVYDQETGETKNLTFDSSVPINYESKNPDLSDNGRYITFESGASLVTGDLNYRKDIYVYDQITKQFRVITQGDDHSENPAISGDGRYIIFSSRSKNLVKDLREVNENIWVQYVYLFDQESQEIQLVSVNNDGTAGNDDSLVFGADINQNGQQIVFESKASNLVNNDNNSKRDIFLRSQGSYDTTVTVELDPQFKDQISINDLAKISGETVTVELLPGEGYLIHNFADVDTGNLNLNLKSFTEDKITFDVRLKSQPESESTVIFSDGFETTENPTNSTQITFTPDNWNQVKTVSLNNLDLTDQGYQIKGNQDGLIIALPLVNPQATLSIQDDDIPGIRIVNVGEYTTVREEETALFEISLLSEPNAPVQITLTPGSEIDFVNPINPTTVLVDKEIYYFDRTEPSLLDLNLESLVITNFDQVVSLNLRLNTQPTGNVRVILNDAIDPSDNRPTELFFTLTESNDITEETNEGSWNQFKQVLVNSLDPDSQGKYSISATILDENGTILESSIIPIQQQTVKVEKQTTTITINPEDWYKLKPIEITGSTNEIAEPGVFRNTTIDYSVSSADSSYHQIFVPRQTIQVADIILDAEQTALAFNEGLDALNDGFGDVTLPFVGAFGDNAPDLIGSFNQELTTAIAAEENLTAKKLQTIVEQVLGKIGFDFIEVSTTVNDEEIYLLITVQNSYPLFDLPLSFDLGLPALGMGFNGSVASDFNYNLTLGLGFHKHFGFFFDTAASKFQGDVTLHLQGDDGQNFSGYGNVGFLNLDFEDDPNNPSKLQAYFSVALNDPDPYETINFFDANNNNKLDLKDLEGNPLTVGIASDVNQDLQKDTDNNGFVKTTPKIVQEPYIHVNSKGVPYPNPERFPEVDTFSQNSKNIDWNNNNTFDDGNYDPNEGIYREAKINGKNIIYFDIDRDGQRDPGFETDFSIDADQKNNRWLDDQGNLKENFKYELDPSYTTTVYAFDKNGDYKLTSNEQIKGDNYKNIEKNLIKIDRNKNQILDPDIEKDPEGQFVQGAGIAFVDKDGDRQLDSDEFYSHSAFAPLSLWRDGFSTKIIRQAIIDDDPNNYRDVEVTFIDYNQDGKITTNDPRYTQLETFHGSSILTEGIDEPILRVDSQSGLQYLDINTNWIKDSGEPYIELDGNLLLNDPTKQTPVIIDSATGLYYVDDNSNKQLDQGDSLIRLDKNIYYLDSSKNEKREDDEPILKYLSSGTFVYYLDSNSNSARDLSEEILQYDPSTANYYLDSNKDGIQNSGESSLYQDSQGIYFLDDNSNQIKDNNELIVNEEIQDGGFYYLDLNNNHVLDQNEPEFIVDEKFVFPAHPKEISVLTHVLTYKIDIDSNGKRYINQKAGNFNFEARSSTDSGVLEISKGDYSGLNNIELNETIYVPEYWAKTLGVSLIGKVKDNEGRIPVRVEEVLGLPENATEVSFLDLNGDLNLNVGDEPLVLISQENLRYLDIDKNRAFTGDHWGNFFEPYSFAVNKFNDQALAKNGGTASNIVKFLDDGFRLTLNELINLKNDKTVPWSTKVKDLFPYQLMLDANLGLKTKTSILNSQVFPSFGFDLALTFPTKGLTNQPFEQMNSTVVDFNNVYIDLGSFLGEFTKPFIDAVDYILTPAKPLVTLINADTKLFTYLGLDSQLDVDGKNGVSVLDLAKVYLKGKHPYIDRAIVFADMLTQVVSLVDALASLPTGENNEILLGSFSLDDFKAASNTPVSSASNIRQTSGSSVKTTSQPNTSPDQQAGKNGKFGSTYKKLINLKGIDIPILTNPITALRLILGEKDIDLITYDIPDFGFQYHLDVPSPMYAGISGIFKTDFSIVTNFDVGYDTRGIEAWAKDDFAPQDIYKILDGFYIDDWDIGTDKDEFTVNGLLELGVGVNALFFQGNVLGGLDGKIQFDLEDVGEKNGTSDGKVRAGEIISRLDTPLELFQLSGAFEAYLKGEFKVGIPLAMRTVWAKKFPLFQVAKFSIGGDQSNSGTVSQGYIGYSIVFFDTNFNQIQEENEPWTQSNQYGQYVLDLSLDDYDLNNNGKIDPEEGQIVIMGGVDLSTGLGSKFQFMGAVDSNMVTPLTTLKQKLISEGINLETAENLIKTRLQIPEGVVLGEFDPFLEIGQGNTDGVATYLIHVQLQTLFNHSQAFLAGLEGRETGNYTDKILSAFTEIAFLNENTDIFLNLTNVELLTVIFNKLSEQVIPVDPVIPEVITTIATIVAESNETIQESAQLALERNIHNLVPTTSAIKFITQGELTTITNNLAQGNITDQEALITAENQLNSPYYLVTGGLGDLTRTVNISVANELTEGAEIKTSQFTITLNEPAPNQGLTVLYTISGNATQGKDYQLNSETLGQVYIKPNEYSATIDIEILDDNLRENPETITIELIQSGEGFEIDTEANIATLNLVDNDANSTEVDDQNLNDIISGKDKDNLIVDNLGNDFLTGGKGADTFILKSPDFGFNYLTDFNPEEGDRILISAEGFKINNLSEVTFVNGILSVNNQNIALIGNQNQIYGYIPDLTGINLTYNSDDDTEPDPIETLLNDPLFRFQNSDRPGAYIYAGEAESQNIHQNFPNFKDEGFAFKVCDEADDQLIVFNRFQNTAVAGSYLYAGEAESQSIRQNFLNFKEEGVAFYALDGDANLGVDIYRLQNTQQPGTYIFVGEEEKNNILTNFPQFTLEGVAFEVVV